MALKRKSTTAQNPLRSDASSSTDPSPSNVRFRDDDAFKAFSENFSRRGIHSEHQVVLSDFTDTDLPSVIHSTSRFVRMPSAYPRVLLQHRSLPLFFTCVRGTRIPITPQLVADVLRVLKIEFPDYPSCERLRIVSRDELMSSFCERPIAWGEHLFTPCRPFAKGLRFMNMVMNFVLHPLSHYNSITEPRA